MSGDSHISRPPIQFELELAGGTVPALLLRPRTPSRVPAVLLLHAWNSNKERLTEAIGRTLVDHGIASLAIDLPLHGGRAGAVPRRDPWAMVANWRLALREARAAVRWLGVQPWVSPGRIAVLGYSLGSYGALVTAAREPLVRAVVVAAGGDIPAVPWSAMVRALGDPVRAVRELHGRPLLMVHGRHDRVIPPALAQRLFDAAGEPRQLLWYDTGHLLTHDAAADAAVWLNCALGNVNGEEQAAGA